MKDGSLAKDFRGNEIHIALDFLSNDILESELKNILGMLIRKQESKERPTDLLYGVIPSDGEVNEDTTKILRHIRTTLSIPLSEDIIVERDVHTEEILFSVEDIHFSFYYLAKYPGQAKQSFLGINRLLEEGWNALEVRSASFGDVPDISLRAKYKGISVQWDRTATHITDDSTVYDETLKSYFYFPLEGKTSREGIAAIDKLKNNSVVRKTVSLSTTLDVYGFKIGGERSSKYLLQSTERSSLYYDARVKTFSLGANWSGWGISKTDMKKGEIHVRNSDGEKKRIVFIEKNFTRKKYAYRLEESME
jgi:hypothetical protein